MKKVILELEENPPIKFAQNIAYSLGIMLTKKKNYPWLYNNFIQVYCDRDIGFDSFRMNELYFFKSPIFLPEIIDEAIMKKFNIDILDYVRFALDIKKWVFINWIDEYYNPERMLYKKGHFKHDLLIYGYDDETENFTIIGYDKNGQYKRSQLSYSDFLLGEPSRVHLLKINEDYEKHLKLDIPHIKLLLKQYLNIVESTAVGDELFDNSIYGQEVFRYMTELINNKEYYDIRIILLFYEHKKCMMMRIEYLQSVLAVDFKTIIDSYKEVVHLARLVQAGAVKYNITKDHNINERIQKYVIQALSIEKICLLDFLEKLS
jgi:hypothetical protein